MIYALTRTAPEFRICDKTGAVSVISKTHDLMATQRRWACLTLFWIYVFAGMSKGVDIEERPSTITGDA